MTPTCILAPRSIAKFWRLSLQRWLLASTAGLQVWFQWCGPWVPWLLSSCGCVGGVVPQASWRKGWNTRSDGLASIRVVDGLDAFISSFKSRQKTAGCGVAGLSRPIGWSAEKREACAVKRCSLSCPRYPAQVRGSRSPTPDPGSSTALQAWNGGYPHPGINYRIWRNSMRRCGPISRWLEDGSGIR